MRFSVIPVETGIQSPSPLVLDSCLRRNDSGYGQLLTEVLTAGTIVLLSKADVHCKQQNFSDLSKTQIYADKNADVADCERLGPNLLS